MKHSIKRIFLFLCLSAFISSCDRLKQQEGPDPAVQAEKNRIEQERRDLEEQKADFDRQVAQEEERKRREEVKQQAKHASKFSVYSEAVAVSPKCYFYSMPDPSAIRRSYLVEGDRVMIQKIQRNFVYVDFFNEYSGKSTSGWLDTQDLEPVSN
ncbi:MAG: hypothetical protein ACKOQ6_05695 [Bacteroidota bacterium]